MKDVIGSRSATVFLECAASLLKAGSLAIWNQPTWMKVRPSKPTMSTLLRTKKFFLGGSMMQILSLRG